MEKSLIFCQQDNTYLLDNYIDGQEIFSLSESNIKTMVPPLGLGSKIF